MGLVWELYAPTHVLLGICSLLAYGLLPTNLSFSAYYKNFGFIKRVDKG